MIVVIDAGFQESENQFDGSATRDAFPNFRHQLVVVDTVEKLLKIDTA